MKSVERRSINDSGLVSDQHPPTVIEGIDHHCARVAEPDLKDGLLVFAPPFLADRGVIVAQGVEVADDGESPRYFWDALYLSYIC